MHPGFWAWWQRQAEAARNAGWSGCETGVPHPGSRYAGRRCGPSERAGGHWHASGFDEGGGGFGVRRPLRFLAYKLELSDEQVAALARVLDDLKIERAQAAVDLRRSSAAFVDALTAEPFDAAAVDKVAAERARSAERVARAVARFM